MATLTVTHKESLILHGREQGSDHTFTIENVDEAYTRVVNCAATQETKVAVFKQTNHSSDEAAITVGDAKYLRITNLDTTNDAVMSLQISGGENYTANQSTSILLEAEKSFVLSALEDAIATDDDQANFIDLANLNDLESIIIKPATALDVEVFVAAG